jgi:hypothetical protein
MSIATGAQPRLPLVIPAEAGIHSRSACRIATAGPRRRALAILVAPNGS